MNEFFFQEFQLAEVFFRATYVGRHKAEVDG
jgi:hypothetical protein